ncbi:hypothetical protein PV08_01122 [Exophiala spinifera]|uniref:ABM domain-containing protein n=1 Tax=Exophiala spinifera TaxID=91928 RepID=A0A0D2A719_9EURO|nr:uncharacterized protein PV08_01122 [Exophiala spinifera]KIW20547.1 hypothetical protein PV08_01122 [Exophiala spinifera]
MAPVTETVLAPMSDEKIPADYSGDSGQKLKDLFTTIVAQDGCQQLFWGPQVENPGTLCLFVDWASVDHHKKFIASEAYKPFVEAFTGLLTGSMSMYHVGFDPHPPTPTLVGSTPQVTEFITAYFPKDYSAENQRTFHEIMLAFGDVVSKTAKGFKASRGGFVREEVTDPKSSEPCLGYVTLIGWESVQAHLDYRETQAFKDNIVSMREAKDLRNVTVFHVDAKQF